MWLIKKTENTNLSNKMFLSGVIFLLHFSSASALRRGYIVHMDHQQMPMIYETKSQWYETCLRSATDLPEMVYTYKHAVDGFAARFTAEEVETFLLQPGVISVFPDVCYKLHTTRTPFFLGLDAQPEPSNVSVSFASDVIVGVIDTGVWPESRSFNDKGFSPPPKTWKGECEQGTNFTASLCNRKLIGARFLVKGFEAEHGPINVSQEFRSPRDSNGHGTHTCSIAGGSVVKGASFLGYAAGVARGMAPGARVATYKACWYDGFCMSSDVLAAIDKAIEDNVNVLSISLGLGLLDYEKDGIAIGALAAVERGIFVSASAGNDGPDDSTAMNAAPWITTVGAGTLDHDFQAIAILGNSKAFAGVSSLFKRHRRLPVKQVPLVYAQLGGNFTGKIVLVDMGTGVTDIDTGALGIIYANTHLNGGELVAQYGLIPSVTVDKQSGDKIRAYILTEPNPTATIKFKGTVLNVKPSPVVAAFSSRGPNHIMPEILKPDVIAPGVNIIAAWTRATGPSSNPDLKQWGFRIESGTSMSCPHVSGLAALLKAAHPDWSPAAIRSAFMTTANVTSDDGKPLLDSVNRIPSTPFAQGAGHVSPVHALNPGLIYDLTAEDYLDLLCASNYTSSQIRIIARHDFTCDPKKKYRVADFNYPSFAVRINLSRGGDGAYKYTRVVRSVGGAGTYTVNVISDKKAVNISVEPAVLNFKQVNEKKSYTVTFTVNPSMPSETNSFGSIEWSDGRHVVRSPVALSWRKW